MLKQKHVAVFLFLFFASFIICETINRSFVRTGADTFRTLDDFRRRGLNAQVIFLGDSHFMRGIDTEQFDYATFNLSFGGANYIQSYYLLEDYIDRLPFLKIVVLPVELHSFSSFRTRRNADAVFWNEFINYDELIAVGGMKFLLHKYYLTLLDPAFGRAFFLKNLQAYICSKLTHTNTVFNRGQRWEFTYKDAQERTAQRIKFHFHGYKVFDPDLLTYFEKILKLCRRNNIAVVTVQMPVSNDYLACAEPYITKDEFFRTTVENPKYAAYIYANFDYLELYKDNQSFFQAEGDHVNLKGKATFSRQISKDLSAILAKAGSK